MPLFSTPLAHYFDQLTAKLSLKSALSLSVVVALSGTAACLLMMPERAALAQTYALGQSINVPNGGKLVSVEASNEDLRKVLYDLSQSTGLNLVIDGSVSGKITLELNRVTLNDALQAIATTANLAIVHKSGNIYLVLANATLKESGQDREYSKVIKVNYANANRLATMLNQTLFGINATQAASTGTTQQKVMADSRTNSLMVVGSEQDIRIVQSAVLRLDMPRQSRTFYLSNANALNVASLLASTVFNDGTAQLNLQGGSGASGAGAVGGGFPVTPSQMNVEQERIQEGSGINNFGGQSGSNSTAGLGQSITLRGTVKQTGTVGISPEGPIIIPDTRTNAVTVMGTVEQIALAESMIPIMDAQLPQVSIEASLVELTESGVRDVGPAWGIGRGRFQFGFNNESRAYNAIDGSVPAGLGQQVIGLQTVNGASRSSGAGFTSNPVTNSREFTAQLRALVTSNKARILANPTIVATHDSESVISIVDEIVRRTTVEQSSSIIGLTTQQVEIGEAGIVLDILPKIGEDGTITMRLRPSVSTIRDVNQTDSFGNDVTLLSKRDFLAQQVRVRDGETIVIGGLIKEEDSISNQKMPGLANLPIVGALFRATRRENGRSELVLMVTPHILSKTDLVPVNYTQSTLQN